MRPPRTDEQLRNSFSYKLYTIKLANACRMYRVMMPTEEPGYHAHNALWDAEVAGRLYFAMRGIAYATPAPALPESTAAAAAAAGTLPPAKEAAWARFQAGESLQQIASTQLIQPLTVLNYLLDVLAQGFSLDVQRLTNESAAFDCAPPSQLEWGQLAAAEAASTIDVKQVKKVNLTELLATFLVEARKPRCERTEKEKATLSAWFAKAAWFVALRRAGRA